MLDPFGAVIVITKYVGLFASNTTYTSSLAGNLILGISDLSIPSTLKQ
jgi:hypothetical protein